MTPLTIHAEGPAMRVIVLMTAEAIIRRRTAFPYLFLMACAAGKALVLTVKFIIRLLAVVKRP